MIEQNKETATQDEQQSFSPIWVNKVNIDLGTVPEC